MNHRNAIPANGKFTRPPTRSAPRPGPLLGRRGVATNRQPHQHQGDRHQRPEHDPGHRGGGTWRADHLAGDLYGGRVVHHGVSVRALSPGVPARWRGGEAPHPRQASRPPGPAQVSARWVGSRAGEVHEMAQSGMRFDLRRAPFSPLSEADLYKEASRCGLGGANRRGSVASRLGAPRGRLHVVAHPGRRDPGRARATSRVMVNALLVPLHDPVRLAEDVATLDLLSGGRFARGRPGVPPRRVRDGGRRPKADAARVEDNIQVMLKAWTGEPFEWQGRTIVVTPTPVSPAQQLLIVGGSVRASAERAARLGLGFFTMSDDPDWARATRPSARRPASSTASSSRRPGRRSCTSPRTRNGRGQLGRTRCTTQ